MGRTVKYIVRLTSDERKMLFELIDKGRASKEKLNRARILLKADCGEEGENWGDRKIAEALYVTEKTVFNTRQSLVEEGLENTIERNIQKKRKKRIIQGDEEAYLVALTCGEPPAGHCKWTLRLLADKMVELEYVEEISHETVRDALKKNEIKPWQKKEWCIPPQSNAEFVCQMEEVLDIYKRPYDPKYPVVCVDESSKQLTKDVREPLAAKSGTVYKYDTEYERNGTASIFMGFEPLCGVRFTKITERRTQIDWAIYIKDLVDNHYREAEKIIFVMDNLNTHHKSSLYTR